MLKRAWSFILGAYFGASMIVMGILTFLLWVTAEVRNEEKKKQEAKEKYPSYKGYSKVKRGEK